MNQFIGVGQSSTSYSGSVSVTGTLDFCGPLSLPSKVANQYQPICGGNDCICSYLRGNLSRRSHRTPVASLLALSPFQTRWSCGRTFVHHFSGTFSRLELTPRFRPSSGTLASFLTSQRFVTEQPVMCVSSFTDLLSRWTGSARHWHRYERAYLILAGLATPLVLSVHSVVSFDFAVSQVPGWHTTIFPPYFVAGAIFSGFAMVVTLSVPAREWFGFKELITVRHLENMNKIILVTGTMVGYAYAMEFFVAWYSGNPYEKFAFINRATGPYWWAYWTMVSCNVISPQIFWFKKLRTNVWVMWIVSIFVNIGMWFERFVITITS